jgi:secretion/DNA translocation related CpaE-like protein
VARSSTLVIGDDPDLLPSVLRLCAVAGREVEVVELPAQGRAAWALADDVLVLAPEVPGCVEAGLRRRDGVSVIATADDTVPWRAVLALGADAVVPLPGGEADLLDRLARPSAPAGSAAVVGVLPASGGAGASVLAAGLAVAAVRRGAAAVLVDADPDGCGADLLLGAEDVAGARWPQLADAGSGLAAETLRAALPSAHGVHVLAVDRSSAVGVPAGAAAAVVACAASGFDLVVVDLPRGRPDILDALLPSCATVLLVCTDDVRGAAAASRQARRLAPSARAEVVVRTLPGASLDAAELPGWLGLPAAAEVAHDPRLLAALDRGEPPGAPRSRLGKVCDALVPRWL